VFKQLNDKEFYVKSDEILSDNLSKEIDIEQKLTKYFGKSFSYIKQRYRVVSRKTIFVTLEKNRLDYAKKHLLKKSCLEVMLDLGFSNESYFAKWFRKYTKMNPSEYRKIYGNSLKDC